MPAEVETSLQQLDLAAGADANSAPAASGTQQEQPVTHDQHEQEQQETPAALHNTACLAATFSLLESEQSLLQCSAVCRLWQSVLEADDIWRRVYLRHLPEPLLHERVSRWVGRVAATSGSGRRAQCVGATTHSWSPALPESGPVAECSCVSGHVAANVFYVTLL